MSRTSAHGTTGRRSSSLALRTTQPTLTSGKHKTEWQAEWSMPYYQKHFFSH